MTPNRQFSLALDSLAELKLQSNPTSQSQPTAAISNSGGLLAEIGPLPREALFLGMASDGLPVLLNLHNPQPGPMLVIGEAGAGKTAFLQYVVKSVVQTHQESDVQYGVITNRIDEWNDVGKTKHLAGIFDVSQPGAQELISSLAAWAHSNKDTKQSVLLLVDDLEAIAKLDFEAVQNFRWLLLRGPARRVWPLITMSAERYGQVLAWIDIFRTRIFGRIANGRLAEALGGDKASALDQLEVGKQFALRENGGWLRFHLTSF
jgi:NACHT domain